MLLDSNLFIYAILPSYAGLRQWCSQQPLYASDITRLEVLGYHKLNELDRRDLTELFALTTLYPVTSEIISGATQLRQQRKMSLGDALIAATALAYHQTLATRNTVDFAWVEGLTVFNPLEGEAC